MLHAVLVLCYPPPVFCEPEREDPDAILLIGGGMSTRGTVDDVDPA